MIYMIITKDCIIEETDLVQAYIECATFQEAAIVWFDNEVWSLGHDGIDRLSQEWCWIEMSVHVL